MAAADHGGLYIKFLMTLEQDEGTAAKYRWGGKYKAKGIQV